MDLELSDDEAALRDNVRAVLSGICPPTVVRSVYDGGPPPTEVWHRMVELGWPALAIGSRHGGLGLGFVELALVAEELGRAVVPSPLLATTTQFAPAVRELGAGVSGGGFLGALATEGTTGTLALAEGGRWSADAVRLSARRDGDRWILSGDKDAVVDGATADEIAVIARGPAGLGAFVVAGSAVTAASRVPLDPTLPVADLHLDGVVVESDRVLAEPGAGHVERALARCLEQTTVALAAMTVGACRRIFEETVDYAKAREQFGRPIGSFQALKHRMADMYISVERSTALVYLAALTIAEDVPERSRAAAAAKAAAGDCQRLVAEEALQLHGGIGYTWEHDLHFLLKRAKTGDALFGDATAHRAALAGLLGLVPGAAAEEALCG
jgi:alkylation response protein AidB-like acyl-CoA dehydrogenase